MLFQKDEPFVRQALHARLDMQKATKDLFQPLQARDSRLFYILSARGELYIDGVSYPLRPDTILLFKAGTPYEWRVNYADYYAVNFDFDQSHSHIQQTFHPFRTNVFHQDMVFDCGNIEDYPPLNQPIVLYKSIAVKHQIQNIITESALNDPWNRPLLSSMLKRVLLEILRAQSNKANDMEPMQNIKEIIGYIQDHYMHPLTNANIAESFGYNPTYLGRIFKAQTGVTLHEFIAELRLNAAMSLLCDTELPIGQICKQVGIPDNYHFSKYFKEKTGKTPSQYRKEWNM